MQEPARFGVDDAESAHVPHLAPRSWTDQRPNWPVAGTRPPAMAHAGEPTAERIEAVHLSDPAAQQTETAQPGDIATPSAGPGGKDWAQPPVIPGPAMSELGTLPPPQWPLINPALAARLLTDRLPIDRLPPDRLPPDQPSTDQPSTDQPSPDRLPPDQPSTDQLPPDQPSTDWPSTDWPSTDWPPTDWPPAEAPMPEDEPTEPIEGLRWWAGADESTAEVPVVARRAGNDAAPPGRRWMIGAGAAAALLVLAGVGAITFAGNPATLADYREGAGDAAAVRAPWDGRTKAGFDFTNGATAIIVRTGDLGGDLYQISTPAAEPQVSEAAGRVRLSLGGGGANAVEVALSDKVRWDLSVGGGADMITIDLSDARLAAVDLAGGASQINLSLPKPDGTLTVRMTGGVSRFDVHTVGQVPVRLRVGSGAGQVVLDGTSHSGVAAGTLFTPALWDQTVDRIDLDAVAGMSALTIGP